MPAPETTPQKRGRGRPSKLTEQTKKLLLGAIRGGLFYEQACRAAGVSYDAFNAWMKRGAEQTSGAYYDFRQEVLDAENRLETSLVSGVLTEAQGGSLPAKFWLLERRFAKRWARKDQVDVNVKIADEVRKLAQQRGLSAEDAEEAVRAAQQILGASA